MKTKFFGESNKNKFIKELKKVLVDFASKEEVDEIINSIGQADGIASLDGSGKVPSEQLPSYVDDIIEVEDYAHLPEEGETGKIYITLDNDNQYRWSGSTYVPLNANNIEGDGVKKIIKLSKAEYDALTTKDLDTIYLVNEPKQIPNGVYIIYTDGSLSNYDTLDSGKTPIGVGLKTNNVSLIIHPTQPANNQQKNWCPTSSDKVLIDGVTTVYNSDSAILDYLGKSNTAAVIASEHAGTAFTFATNIGSDWYLPACGEMEEIRLNVTNINIALGLISGTVVDFDSNYYWSSTQYSSEQAWNYNYYSSKWSTMQKTGLSKCRAVKELVSSDKIYKLYIGNVLIADSNTINDIASILATI